MKHDLRQYYAILGCLIVVEVSAIVVLTFAIAYGIAHIISVQMYGG